VRSSGCGRESFPDLPLILFKCEAGPAPRRARPLSLRIDPVMSLAPPGWAAIPRTLRTDLPMVSLPRRAFIVLGAASLLAACSSVNGPPPGVATAPAQLTTEGIVSAINGVRKANGRPPLKYNYRLEAAARSQAQLMASKDQLSHNLGVTLRQRVREAGYEGAVGENVAGGQQTLEQAIQGWLASPSHRDTLLSTKFIEFGLAVASVPSGTKSRYGTYWAFIAGGSFEAWRV
jgi:uncharacterized protein YkwD